MEKVSRRNLLRKTALAASGLPFLSGLARESINKTCQLTPEQTEGPFYPVADQNDKDNDLTIVKGKSKNAIGEVIIIKGKVLDGSCRPVANALVEIWQACASGRYNHPGDTNPAPLDPNFQYWGRALTNKNGEYIFKTIKPGHYPATNTWTRPAHIHFKVHRRGYEELTGQIYFKGDRYNQTDRILQSLSREDQNKVIIDLGDSKKSGDSNLAPIRTGTFDITIREI